MAFFLKFISIYIGFLSLGTVYLESQFVSQDVLDLSKIKITISSVMNLKTDLVNDKLKQDILEDIVNLESASSEKKYISVVDGNNGEKINGELQIEILGKSDETEFNSEINFYKYANEQIIKITKWGFLSTNAFIGKNSKKIPLFDNKIMADECSECGVVVFEIGEDTTEVQAKLNKKEKVYLNTNFEEVNPEYDEYKFIVFKNIKSGIKEFKVNDRSEKKIILPVLSNEITYINSDDIDSDLNIGRTQMSKKNGCLTNMKDCSAAPSVKQSGKCNIEILTNENIKIFDVVNYRTGGEIKRLNNNISYSNNKNQFLIIKSNQSAVSAVCSVGTSLVLQI